MEHIKIDGVEGNFKHLDSTPPEGVKPPVNVLTTEVIVENNPQPLRTIKPYAQACLSVPEVLGDEAKIVLHALFECFAKAGEVKEGLIGDVLAGFAAVGISPTLTYVGLKDLAKAGYLKFQASDNEYVDIESFLADKAWVRYQPKLLDLVYEQA